MMRLVYLPDSREGRAYVNPEAVAAVFERDYGTRKLAVLRLIGGKGFIELGVTLEEAVLALSKGER